MKKTFALTLALLLLAGLAACGQEEPEPAAESVAAPLPVNEPEPASSLPEEFVLNQAFLTGESKTVDYPEGQRIVGVMVNNIASSRPTRGVSEAKVVVEIQVEGPITRLMCLFENYETMPQVGSVRSARDQFFQLLIPFRGFYIHQGHGYGTGSPTGWLMRDYDYQQLDFDLKEGGTGDSFRVSRPGMPSEYTLYTDGEHTLQNIANHGADGYKSYGSPIFNFQPYNEEPYVSTEGTASDIGVIFNQSYRTLFSYNAATARYEMSMFSEHTGQVHPYIDENTGQQVSFDNVVVIFAPMERYPTTQLMKVDYSQGGGGYIFTRGGFEGVIWRKGPADQPLALKKAGNEEEFALMNVGTTYLAVVNDIQSQSFYDILMAGTAAEAVGQGEVNTGRVDEEVEVDDIG